MSHVTESRPVNRAFPHPPILRFPGHGHPDLPLTQGMNGLCRDPDLDRALMITPGGGSSLIEFCWDARGLWLHVAEGVRGVHVNGRPVQRLARLHLGDGIHCEGVEMLLAGAPPQSPAVTLDDATRASRLVLRGHGGDAHGMAIALDRVQAVGAHATVRPIADDAAHLQWTGAEGECRLNGWPVTEAVLRAGDQLALGHATRWLVESPGEEPASEPRPTRMQAVADAQAPRRWRMPWFLLAAVVSALLFAALLWFGVK